MTASTKRILAIFASLIGFFYALTVFLNSIAPGWTRLLELRSKIAEREMARNQLERLVSRARNYLDMEGELELMAQPIDAALPTTPELPELMVILSTITSRNNAVISQVRFEMTPFTPQDRARDTGPSVSQVNIRANVTGTYPNVKAWLRDIESELRVMRVETIDIRSAVGEGAATPATPMNVDVALTAYWQQ